MKTITKDTVFPASIENINLDTCFARVDILFQGADKYETYSLPVIKGSYEYGDYTIDTNSVPTELAEKIKHCE